MAELAWGWNSSFNVMPRNTPANRAPTSSHFTGRWRVATTFMFLRVLPMPVPSPKVTQRLLSRARRIVTTATSSEIAKQLTATWIQCSNADINVATGASLRDGRREYCAWPTS